MIRNSARNISWHIWCIFWRKITRIMNVKMTPLSGKLSQGWLSISPKRGLRSRRLRLLWKLLRIWRNVRITLFIFSCHSLINLSCVTILRSVFVIFRFCWSWLRKLHQLSSTYHRLHNHWSNCWENKFRLTENQVVLIGFLFRRSSILVYVLCWSMVIDSKALYPNFVMP